jgi:signal transduction histidine kinase
MAPQAPSPLRPAASGRSTILVVDDNPVDRVLTRSLLEHGGFLVTEAEDGIAALALFEREPPALVVADIVMPNMGGLDFCRAMRANPLNVDIPILLASGLREQDAIGAAYEAGANDIIGKPLNETVLLHRVRYMLRAANAFRDLHARQHSQKLEALGTLAGGIAHDLNNALVPIMALSKITSRELSPGSKAQENLETIYRASQQARDMVKRVLAFSRNDITAHQNIQLNEVVAEALKLLQATISPMIDIEASLIEVPPICADASQIHQVLTNLVSNAAAAIGSNHRGKITITLDVVADLACPSELRLSVTDTGAGMNIQVQSRIFQPFFTTKEVNEGTGLGLSVVHGIVLAHNGHIEFKSEPGKGTRFDIYFPIAEIKRAPAQSAA